MKYTLYQPQVDKWDGYNFEAHAAVGVVPAGSKDQIFGAVEMTAVTDVAKVSRTVHFRDVKIVKAVFPTAPDKSAAYQQALQTHGGERPVDHVARPARDLAGHQRRGEEGARRPRQERPAAHRLQPVGRHPGSDRRRSGLAPAAGHQGRARHQHPRVRGAGRCDRTLLRPHLRRLRGSAGHHRTVDGRPQRAAGRHRARSPAGPAERHRSDDRPRPIPRRSRRPRSRTACPT